MVRDNANSMSRIVVTNVLVLTAAPAMTRTNPERRQPIRTRSSRWRSPPDAERIALAATEGKSCWRCETRSTESPRRRRACGWPTMSVSHSPAPKVVTVAGVRKAIVPPPPPPVAQPALSIYKVEAIRASKRSEETVR
jgi:hypothetical protein